MSNKVANYEHQTLQPQQTARRRAAARSHWMLRIRCWTLTVLVTAPLLWPVFCHAQTPPQLSPAAEQQLQIRQPEAVPVVPTAARASFDPPVARPGQKAFYRITVDATESSINLPEKIPAPLTLMMKPVAQGQVIQMLNGRPAPLTTFLFEAIPTTPGRFLIPPFDLSVDGRKVPVQPATIEVVEGNLTNAPTPRQLVLEISATNLFIGQPFKVRVILPATDANEIEALREVQIKGDGLITDRTSMRQSIDTLNLGGQLRKAFVYETTVTPILAGPLTFSAQAFAAGREFSGPISISGQVIIRGGPPSYNLLVSDPIELSVRPLPTGDEPAGFTGSMGQFICDEPQLSTNRLKVGEPVQLKIGIHPVDNLSRLVPPEAPASSNWLIIAGKPPASGFILVPLTDEVKATPAIPFSYFDPAIGKYFDRTIPSLPVTVTGGNLPTQVEAFDAQGKPAAPKRLSELAPTPGKSVVSLQPLQLQGWFVGLQLLPVAGFIALWRWDRHRRFLEAHPEIVRRRRAKRALRRERRKLVEAIAAGDNRAFVDHAVEAMKIACAPHYPAHPQALVCGDVLALLDEADQDGPAGHSVRKLFSAADEQFAPAASPQGDWLAARIEVLGILQKLEDKL